MLLSSRSWKACKGRGIKGLEEGLQSIIPSCIKGMKLKKLSRIVSCPKSEGRRREAVDQHVWKEFTTSARMFDSPRRKRRKSFSQV